MFFIITLSYSFFCLTLFLIYSLVFLQIAAPLPAYQGIYQILQLTKLNVDTITDKIFVPCTNPFFASMNNTRELPTNPNFLTFDHPIPLTNLCILYIRNSYRELAASAVLKPNITERRYVVITGTPGIGKSVFLYYVFWFLMQNKQRVLFIREPSIYFDGNAIFQCNQLPSSGNRDFWNTDLWVLVDSRDPTRIPKFPIYYCSIILASTPRSDIIKSFGNLIPTPPVFYMPLWTRLELEAIAPYYPPSIDWLHRFDVLGGVPRTVLQKISLTPEAFILINCQ